MLFVAVSTIGAGSSCTADVNVTCRGEQVPSSVDVLESEMVVTFVPKLVETHLVHVSLNNEPVPSMFRLHVYSNDRSVYDKSVIDLYV